MSGWTMSTTAHRATDIPRASAPAARRSREYVPRRVGAVRGRARPPPPRSPRCAARSGPAAADRRAAIASTRRRDRHVAPIITSAGECMCRASREIPITPAAIAATRSAAWRQRNSSTARPPATTVAAATCPLGVRISGVPKLPEQARNSTFKASMAENVMRTAAAQAAAPRRHPCISSAMPIASASGRITA